MQSSIPRTQSRRTMVTGVAVTLLLATGSTLGVAAARGAFDGSRCAVPTLPGVLVRATTVDMSRGAMTMIGGHPGSMRLLASRGVVPAGTVSLLVHNAGSRTHELVVLPLAAGAVLGTRAPGTDRRVDEAGSLGEVSRNCGADTGEGINPGSYGWVTLHVSPGRYELVCNLKDHYASGMYTELDVT
jgi:uncharacterized cupredoxin-like copper-binding protein